MLIALVGEDAVSIEQALAVLRAEVDAGGLSTGRLDGASAGVDELRREADAAPFFGGRRLVIVRGLLERLARATERGKEAGAARERELGRLADYLPTVPDWSVVVFDEPGLATLPPKVRAALEAARVEVRQFRVPERPGDLPGWLEGWLREQATALNLNLTREAATRLAADAAANVRAGEASERAARVGNELRRLRNELARLGTYVGQGGSIDGRVVAALSPDARAPVFDLIDAVATRSTARALRLLEQVLAEGAEPMMVIRLIDRQLSALLRAEAAGGSEVRVETALRVPNWLARRYVQQVRAFGGAGLRRAHRHLLTADVAVKTGQASAEAAVRDLVVRVCLDGAAPSRAPASGRA